MFDACNNHGYTNTSEFKIEAISDKPKERQLSLEEQVQQAGLIWDEEKGEFIPDTNKGALNE